MEFYLSSCTLLIFHLQSVKFICDDCVLIGVRFIPPLTLWNNEM